MCGWGAMIYYITFSRRHISRSGNATKLYTTGLNPRFELDRIEAWHVQFKSKHLSDLIVPLVVLPCGHAVHRIAAVVESKLEYSKPFAHGCHGWFKQTLPA